MASPMPNALPVTQTSSTIGRYRWVVCALLFAATTVNYIDRQILSLIKPILDEQLKWTNTQFGWTNSIFQLCYAGSLLIFGMVIDKWGTKIGYAVSIAAWSLAAIGHSLVGSISGFFMARAALGLGEGGNFPSAIKAVALWFPKKERALATSIFNAGTNVGAILAPALVPPIAAKWGWQAAFVAAGIAGFIWLFFWLPFYNVPEKIKSMTEGELALIRSDAPDLGGETGKAPWLSVLKYRQAWAFIAAKFLTDPVWWFFLIWLPDFFKKTRGLDIKKSWVHLVTIYVIVTVLSIAGGWFTGYLKERGYTVTRARKTGMLIFAICVVPIVVVTKVGDWSAVLLIGLAGAAHQAWSANLYTTVSDMFPKRAVATVIGIGGMAGSLGGFLFPIVTGMMLDSFKGNASAGYAILFSICGSAYLLAFVINHLLAPKYEPIALGG
jgi:ACS family hexuronate transporter-like MFS transporter